MLNDILLGIPWGIFLSFMIGPVFFIILETSILKGFRAALVFDLGVIVGDIVFITIAYIGSYRLITSIKDNTALFMFGGILMLSYGVISYMGLHKQKIINSEKIDSDIIKKDYVGLFIKGFFLNIINIGVLGFWLAVIISVGPKLLMQNSRMFTFFASVIFTYLLVDSVKILLAKQLKNKLTPTNIVIIKKGISIVLVIFGIALLIQGWFPAEKEQLKEVLERIDE
jgi:threonine/homoserine/homoserine lactone efflux protein